MLSFGRALSTEISLSLTSLSDTLPTRDWSSLIGIVTAICGNILISFALNTQRYAHLRLSKKREEDEEKRRNERKHSKGRPSGSNQNGYGATPDEAGWQMRTDRAKRQGRYDSTGREAQTTEETALLTHHQRTEEQDDESHDFDAQDEDKTKEKSYLKSPIWWLGIALMVIGEAGNFLAYGFAPASIVSPLGVVALISNCLIAPLLLGEEFRWRDGLGVIIAIAGCVTVVLSASDSNPRLTPESIWHLITRWEFETYLGITAFLIIALTVASNRYGDRTVLIDLGLVGLFGGYTALSTKGIASLLSNKVWRVITFPITYLLLVVLVFTAVMQIKYLNRALQRFNATIVIPTQFVIFTLSVIIGSAVLYRDFERQKTADALKFVGGCALTFLGVWCITSGRRGDSSDDESGQADEDEVLVDGNTTEPTMAKRLDTASFARPLVTVTLDSDRDAVSLTSDSALRTSTMNPANAAAIHAQTASELPAPPIPQPVHATTSEPIVPTLSTMSSDGRPRTLLGRNQTSSSPQRRSTTRPQTPKRNSSADVSLDSNLLPQQTRLLPSPAGLFPGPLTTTLSSSLSAIVADSLRRGVDHFPAHAPSPSRQRPGSINRGQSRRGILTFNFGHDDALPDAIPRKRHSIASGEMPFDAVSGEGPEASTSSRLDANAGQSGRVRSLSATLSDFFSGNSSTGANGSKRRQTGPDRHESNEG